ncbi:hypothetical protein GCM10010388_74930 [Streptomyces mauvecolor]
MHLLENPRGVRRQRHGGVRRLLEIAGTYDRICQRAEGYLQPDVSATDILAVLRVIRTLRDKLDDDERMLLALAAVGESPGRGSPPRWRREAVSWPSGPVPAAEQGLPPPGWHLAAHSERAVEQAREQCSRRAEREWHGVTRAGSG